MTGGDARRGSQRANTRPKRGMALALMAMMLLAGVPLLAAPAQAAPAPASCDRRGPDVDGLWCDRTPFRWANTAGGTTLSLADDEVSDVIVLPFIFPWRNGDRVTAYVGSNGLLCFRQAGCSELNPDALPASDTPNDLVACFWEDLNPSAAGARIRYKTVGTSPDRTFVVEFFNVPHYGSSGNNTFQIQLTEGGEARCMLSTVYDDGDGVPTAVGAENVTGLDGVRYTLSPFEGSQVGIKFFQCICTAPGAPRSLATQTGPGSGQIRLTWEAPADDGGFTVTSYRIYRGCCPATPNSFAAEVTGTTWTDCCWGGGTTLNYHVRAVNNAGEGAPSATVEGRPPGPPGPPQAFTGRPGPGVNQVQLSWADPASDGGFPIHTFRVWRRNMWGGDDLIAQLPASQRTFTDCCFGTGQFNNYRLSALNNAGEGPSAPRIDVRTPVQPSPPLNLQAERGPGAGQIRLSWQPGSDGGIPVTEFRVYRGTAPGNLQFLGTASGTAFTDSGLPEGALRYYAVSARNLVGEGGRSGTVQQLAPTRPSAPQGTTATGGPGFGQVSLDWDAPADLGGLPLQGYQVYRRGAGGAWNLLATPGPGTSAFVDTNASLLTMSHYRVTARNAVGEGSPGNSVCAAPQPWGAIDAPLGEPCPVVGGWEERPILSVAMPLGGDQAIGPVDEELATVDAGPRPEDPAIYDLHVTVLGTALPRISVFDNGAMQSDLSFALLHLPKVIVPVPGAMVEFEVAERHDPARLTCYAGLGDLCAIQAPSLLPAPWLTEAGSDAMLVLRARIRDEAGAVLAEQVVALPYGGLAGAIVPDTGMPSPPPGGVIPGLPPIGAPGVPGLPGGPLPPLPRPSVCLDTNTPETCVTVPS